MQNITKIGKIGDIFIRRDGKECIWVASDGIGSLKYRFRLLSEHNIKIEEYKYIKSYSPEFNPDVFKKHLHPSYWKPVGTDKEFNIEEGDWYVRFNGSSMACNKWEEPLDIIKKADIK